MSRRSMKRNKLLKAKKFYNKSIVENSEIKNSAKKPILNVNQKKTLPRLIGRGFAIISVIALVWLFHIIA